ncbi:MAG: hypothetical protein ACLFPN_05460 [Methanomassiliicoccales archaeon]
MVVKEKRGRRRYIAFTVSPTVPRPRIKALLERAAAEVGVGRPKLIQFDGRKGIVRCNHLDKDGMIEALERAGGEELEIATLRTSGTLRKLRQRYFEEEVD